MDQDDDEPASGDQEPDPPGTDFPLQAALETFRQQQRLLASLDLRAITGAHQMIVNSDVLASIEKSVDFSALQDTVASIEAASGLAAVPTIDPGWTDQLTKSIDVSAITRANERILNDASMLEAVQRQTDALAGIAASIDYSALTSQLSSVLDGIDWDKFRKDLDSWLPANLRSADDLDAVARIALEDGLPLVWIPRAEIVDELTGAATPEDRLRILSDHSKEVLDDCEAVLRPISHEWSDQCGSAIEALRAGHHGPAQSHAGGIIDSIVLAVLGGNGRQVAKQRAEDPYDDLPLRVAIENFVLRPLFRGFVRWFPGGGLPVPNHFARHPTAHAVGHAGVFSEQNALIAVMLATSLTAQFWDDPAAP
jgi:hypothetical protein